MERHARYTAHPGASVCVVSCKLIIKHLIFYFILFYFSFTSPGFYSFTTPFAWQNNAPDDEGLASSSLLYILFINTGGGGEGRRMTSWKGLLLLLGLAFLLFDPTRCVYNHVVCARFLGFFFVFFFFSLVVVYWPSKGGQQHTREPSVCVFIYI